MIHALLQQRKLQEEIFDEQPNFFGKHMPQIADVFLIYKIGTFLIEEI